ncbi:DUF2812 domain-containing protein [Anaerococcus sp. AGMB00486]|uniref:DUF2812 domain-containing protein n=2 Tax=Anaerococcus TaxID=165779 RepID=A0ABX2N862_9FIRM|nr:MULTISPECIES: DUF2812 domain-containing protein [Anaerococcus]MSS78340.1 DUF2812 domain-containing protein [Anaerococcus porci]NVF10754.1 DUF2812 domain-containing protein [Anaerococcus faecalis]
MYTVFKIFLNPIEDRENYLNKMAKQGYELVSSGGLIHKFKKTDKNKSYIVQYIGYMSNRERREYMKFVENMDMKVLYSPLNLGKRSFGNIKFRLFNPIKSSIATSHGMINREIMILENDTDKKIEVYSDKNSKIEDLSKRKNPYICLLVLLMILISIGLMKTFGISTYLFNKTLLSFRTLNNVIAIWIILGIAVMIYSIINLSIINNLIKKIDS